MEIGSIFDIKVEDMFNNNNVSSVRLPFMKEEIYNIKYFNTGRSAIEALLLKLKKTRAATVWVPSYCCSSVYDAITRANFNIKRYEIETDLSISYNQISFLEINKEDVFYIIHFFGKKFSDKVLLNIRNMQKEGIIVIEDISLALLSDCENSIGFGDFIIGSLRKWFPIPDGAFLYSVKYDVEWSCAQASNDYTMYYFAAQIMKRIYLENRKFNKTQFLSLSNEGMKMLFSDYTIRDMSLVSKNLYSYISIEEIKNKRKRNYDYLYKLLSEIKEIILPIERESGMVPIGMYILTSNRDNLFNFLIKCGIYCNIHWRIEDYDINLKEKDLFLSNHCLTIPCDHRYNYIEMEYIYQCIKAFWGGKYNV